MNIFSVLEQQYTDNILYLLFQGIQTSHQISNGLGIPEDEISNALAQLEESGLIVNENGKYIICTQLIEKNVKTLIKYCNIDSLSENKIDESENSDIKESLYELFFKHRESDFHHASFDDEIAFYEGIRSGNLEIVKLLYTPLGGKEYGVLSKNPLNSLKYHLVITIAMITRFCVNGGMQTEEAYNLSDVYILKADECTSEEEIHNIHCEVISEFTKRMQQIRNRKKYSKQIVKVLDYISDHLHGRITIQAASDYLSLSVPYLSRLFKSETGVAFSEYIIIKKVEAAANMLQFSNYSSSEVSMLLNFSSQSYFIKVFKKHTGMTPKEYRSRYYSAKWNIF